MLYFNSPAIATLEKFESVNTALESTSLFAVTWVWPVLKWTASAIKWTAIALIVITVILCRSAVKARDWYIDGGKDEIVRVYGVCKSYCVEAGGVLLTAARDAVRSYGTTQAEVLEFVAAKVGAVEGAIADARAGFDSVSTNL